MTTLSADLVRVLSDRRITVVPFVGAGLSRGANVPGTSEVARALRERAGERGVSIDEHAEFVAVCASFEAEFGLGTLQDETAAVVLASEPDVTPELRAVARCPSRIIVTANYDLALERAVEDTGRCPDSYWLDRAGAWMPPPEGCVHVVHLHGIATAPRTMVFPGASTEALERDDRFQTVLRAIVAPRTALYLGFRFGETETHLRTELDWLARSFTDAGDHTCCYPRARASSVTTNCASWRLSR